MNLSTTVLLLLLMAPPRQDKFPVEDDAWLRFKPGTWIENKVTVEVGDSVIVSTQKQLLREKSGDDYLIVESGTSNDKELPSVRTRQSVGTITGKETVVVDGKEYPCRISVAKGLRDDGTSIIVNGPPILQFPTDWLQLAQGQNPDPKQPVPVIDPWGNAIKYKVPGQFNKTGVDIWSMGANGQDDLVAAGQDTDDISNWNKEY